MSAPEEKFTGVWLHQGDRRGEDFSHTADQYDHGGEESGSTGATPMRHIYVDQDGSKVGVWVPADWSEDQAREALQTNW